MTGVVYREGTRYFPYEDAERAHEGEESIVAGLGEELWTDPDFPPGPGSLFMVTDLVSLRSHGPIRWRRFDVSALDLELKGPIFQGDLGNTYLINALSLLGRNKDLLQQIVVSLSNAKRGLLTFRFSLEGRWVYLHVDSWLPCRTFGELVFARSVNSYLVSFIEKALAKLFGSYEALTHGTVEQALRYFSPTMAVLPLRFEKELSEDTACDEVWGRLEEGLDCELGEVGCIRTLPDPYGERAQDRKGIELDQMYEVLGVVVAEAAASLDYDAITVGLVCLRAIQSPEAGGGMFEGRWRAGHELWSQFPQINATVKEKTDSIIDRIRQVGSSREVESCELFWMQIEDFVDSFNRLYFVRDYSILPHYHYQNLHIRTKPMPKADIHDSSFFEWFQSDNVSAYPVRYFSIHVIEKSPFSAHVSQRDSRLRYATASDPQESYFWSQIDRCNTREAVLEQSLVHAYAIGLVIFRLEKSHSNFTANSTIHILKVIKVNSNSTALELTPGFYAIVPIAIGSSSLDLELSLVICTNTLNIETIHAVEITPNFSNATDAAANIMQEYAAWEWQEDSTFLTIGGLYAEIANIYDLLQNRKC